MLGWDSLQLISGISRIIKKVFKCFHGITISTIFVLPLFVAFPFIFTLGFNDSEYYN